jgi:hypothetical protein
MPSPAMGYPPTTSRQLSVRLPQRPEATWLLGPHHNGSRHDLVPITGRDLELSQRLPALPAVNGEIRLLEKTVAVRGDTGGWYA